MWHQDADGEEREDARKAAEEVGSWKAGALLPACSATTSTPVAENNPEALGRRVHRKET